MSKTEKKDRDLRMCQKRNVKRQRGGGCLQIENTKVLIWPGPVQEPGVSPRLFKGQRTGGGVRRRCLEKRCGVFTWFCRNRRTSAEHEGPDPPSVSAADPEPGPSGGSDPGPGVELSRTWFLQQIVLHTTKLKVFSVDPT